MEFFTAMVPYLNIGFLSGIMARFTGANLSMLVLIGLLSIGANPIQTVGMMLTFLVFLELTKNTQEHRLEFKTLRIFNGWRILIPVLIITIVLSVNPFYAVAAFIGFFLMETVALLQANTPAAERINKMTWLLHIAIGSACGLIGLTLLQFIPTNWFYAVAGMIMLMICGYAHLTGKNRYLIPASMRNTIIYASYFLTGLIGIEISDWIKRTAPKTHNELLKHLAIISIPTIYIIFLGGNVLYGSLTLSGLIMALAASFAVRLFGEYEASSSGNFSLITLGMSLLAIICLFLVQPDPIGVTDLLLIDIPDWSLF